MRIRDAGFRIVYERRIEVSHFESGSSSSIEEAFALRAQSQAV
jgi:GT2 family glycosyltransferase